MTVLTACFVLAYYFLLGCQWYGERFWQDQNIADDISACTESKTAIKESVQSRKDCTPWTP